MCAGVLVEIILRKDLLPSVEGSRFGQIPRIPRIHIRITKIFNKKVSIDVDKEQRGKSEILLTWSEETKLERR